MESYKKRILLRIGGMSCVSCQHRIEQELRGTPGISKAKADYAAGIADVVYDPRKLSRGDVIAVIERLDYQVLSGETEQRPKAGRVAAILAVIVALYVLLQRSGLLNLLVPGRLADTRMGYGMLFVIGLITSVHCIAMCGGINLSQCIPRGAGTTSGKGREAGGRASMLAPALLYNFGRVLSYTAVGFLLGLAGSLFGGGAGVGLPAMAQGLLKLAAGVFMVIMGLNLLGLFPALRRLQPRIPEALSRKVHAGRAGSRSPLLVGLLNGLMPCGPLQSMQIVALASGNPFAGALSMLAFSLGTVPLMLGLGAIVSALGRKFTHRVMTAGAVLVTVLGLAMLSQGGSLSGLVSPDLLLAMVLGLSAVGIVWSLPAHMLPNKPVAAAAAALAVTAIGVWSMRGVGGAAASAADIRLADGKQVVTSTLSSGSYPNITVQAGMPVKWVINAPDGSINGCNYQLNIREYGISGFTFQPGENVIEFTPDKTGTFSYSCWMGMIRGTITVTDAASSGSSGTADSGAGTSAQPVPAGYRIPTDRVAVAVETTYQGSPVQQVTIQLTDSGFSPAVVVIQSDRYVLWNIQNTASGAEKDTQLLVPAYAAQLPLFPGDNPVPFDPSDSFAFSTAGNAFYGYVKVVDDLKTADLEAIQDEAGNFPTMIWPPETFQAGIADGSAGEAAVATVKDGVQYVTSTVGPAGYQPIRVQEGIPVKWTLNAPAGSLTGCNNAIVVPAYNLQAELKSGDTVLTFTPDKSGTFAFSCWMGMVRSSITVVGADGTVAPTQDDGSDQLPSCCGG